MGLVLLYDESGEYMWRCSGTLLSPTVFMTTGHCAVDTASAKVLFNADLKELEYPYPDCGPYQCWEGTTHTHPNYDDAWPEFPQTYDVGLVILDKRVPKKVVNNTCSNVAVGIVSFGMNWNCKIAADDVTIDGLEVANGKDDLIRQSGADFQPTLSNHQLDHLPDSRLSLASLYADLTTRRTSVSWSSRGKRHTPWLTDRTLAVPQSGSNSKNGTQNNADAR